MQVDAPSEKKTSKGPVFNRSVLNTVLLVLIVVGGSVGGGYYLGFRMGEKKGAEAAINKAKDFLNPLNAISDSPIFPNTLLGKVTAVSKTSLTVKLANGTEKKVVLTDNTKYSKQDKVLANSNVAKDNQVTVFTVGKDNEQTATRVIIR